MAQTASRKELEQQMIQRAQEDPAFRSSLLSDPKAVIEKELGTSLPDGVKVQVMEETSDAFYLVLPPSSSTGADGELSDQELESVAGGWGTAAATTQESCGYTC